MNWRSAMVVSREKKCAKRPVTVRSSSVVSLRACEGPSDRASEVEEGEGNARLDEREESRVEDVAASDQLSALHTLAKSRSATHGFSTLYVS